MNFEKCFPKIIRAKLEFQRGWKKHREEEKNSTHSTKEEKKCFAIFLKYL
jgi:hypothetical protein